MADSSLMALAPATALNVGTTIVGIKRNLLLPKSTPVETQALVARPGRADGHHKIVWFALVAGVALLAGCREEESDQVDGGGVGAAELATVPEDMPPIYVDQTLVQLLNGRNSDRRNYQALLALCRRAGRAIQPLSEEQVAKIGTTRLQRWIKQDKAAYRTEKFSFAGGGPLGDGSGCEFSIVSSGSHIYFDHERTVSIGFGNNKKVVSEPISWLLERTQPLSFDEALAIEMAEIDTHAVTGPPTPQTVAGAPCLNWQSSDNAGSSCVWSGGTQWGFHIGPGNTVLGSNIDMLFSIVLRQDPGARHPVRLTTQRFEIGADFDSGAMEPKPSSTPPAVY